jgi:hypothetical protein
MADPVEDTDEIVFEDEYAHRRVERAAAEDLGFGAARFPAAIKRVGRVFRLRRRELVSRAGEVTHLRVTYVASDEGAALVTGDRRSNAPLKRSRQG